MDKYRCYYNYIFVKTIYVELQSSYKHIKCTIVLQCFV